MRQGIKNALLVLACSVGIMMMLPIPAFAADGSVTFGSQWYEKDEGVTFPVGVYLNADAAIGEYHVTLQYDKNHIEYVDGADSVDTERGILSLDGDSMTAGDRYWIRFRAKQRGNGYVRVTSAQMAVGDAEEELFNITAMGNVPIRVTVNGQTVTGGDSFEEEPPEELSEEELLEEELLEEDPFVEEEPQEEPREEPREEQHEEALQVEELQEDDLFAEDFPEEEVPSEEKKTSVFFNTYVFIVILLVLFIIFVEVGILLLREFLRKDEGQEDEEGLVTDEEDYVIDLDELDEDPEYAYLLPDVEFEQEMQESFGEPVIQVEDVTMEFHLSSNNPSGLKEYLIQLLKREISYRKLYALYHVSFNVYKGEVLGIIGTNGSGKSTILKIVSGALKPTEGRVKVDRKKVQLLTLGTGFDMELTARENVYLNGSIIGYSKEFLDAHYKDIVEFAELEDFMEEKVKNFSSGMVSRLGFAIATAGDAAEILILDEVLSVGDEFFKQKSLKRVKEMIHGGSTVLLVSHNMGTILENCTRCVWIEKGKLQMVGEPKEVCEAYRKQQ